MSKTYFQEILEFLKNYQWIYNYPNTHILVNKILDYFPTEWLPHLRNLTNEELNNLPFGYIDEKWPLSLKKLLEDIYKLKKPFAQYALCNVVDVPNALRIKYKKRHEITHLAAVINEECTKQSIRFIIDVGAGLGYLSILLYERYGYRVLAIEGDKNKFDIASKNQEKYQANSKEFVKFIHYYINDDFVDDLPNILNDNFPQWCESNVCIAGLHACADLSISILKAYCRLELVKSLVIMPCCYHRLKLKCFKNESYQYFENFPLSVSLKTTYQLLRGENFLKIPFMRLACQSTSSSWRTMSTDVHENHLKSCFYRAILQEVVEEETLKIRRLKRKSGKFKRNSNMDIHIYISNLKETHEFVKEEEENMSTHDEIKIDDVILKQKILEKWKNYQNSAFLINILSAFQTSLQSVCEYVVLLDRAEFLRDNGFKSEIYKITSDYVSPRCHALLSSKLLKDCTNKDFKTYIENY